MPIHVSNGTSERPRNHSLASFAFSASERACIAHLVGHSLARVEREFILQTLRYSQGNRTRAANSLGISIRSLRDRIRNYRTRGDSVPEPGSPLLECLDEIAEIWRKVTEESDINN
jgi:Fis family transcriptional regulator, factor for inversion stimulation protein